MSECQTCGVETTNYRTSPFNPCSYPMCDECGAKNLVSYKDLCFAVESRHNYDDLFGPEYMDKYLRPTIKHYGKTEAELLIDAKIMVEEFLKANPGTK